jgi:hypothetical protein
MNDFQVVGAFLILLGLGMVWFGWYTMTGRRAERARRRHPHRRRRRDNGEGGET